MFGVDCDALNPIVVVVRNGLFDDGTAPKTVPCCGAAPKSGKILKKKQLNIKMEQSKNTRLEPM